MRNILLFRNIRKVMQAEKVLIAAKLKFKVMPVPSQLSSECGVCIEVEEVHSKEIEQRLIEKKIAFQYEQI